MRWSNYKIPYWKKYTLSIEEAAAYFCIGEGKLRRLVQENPRADYLLWNGNRVQIKREKFEKFIDTLSAVQKINLKQLSQNIDYCPRIEYY